MIWPPRFSEKYAIEDAGHSTPCWLWTAAKLPTGYGKLWVRDEDGKRCVLAHRLAYERLVGPIPEGLSLDHLCRNRACINPEHLEPVTHKENCLRGVGPIPENAAKVVCANGHPFDEENTYVRPNGTRDCRRCGAARQRAYQLRKKAA